MDAVQNCSSAAVVAALAESLCESTRLLQLSAPFEIHVRMLQWEETLSVIGSFIF